MDDRVGTIHLKAPEFKVLVKKGFGIIENVDKFIKVSDE